MNLKKLFQNLISRKSKGFTLIETIISMTLMAILGVSMWGAFSIATQTSTKVPELSEVGVKLLNMDSTIRSLLNRIKIPFYVPHLDETDYDESYDELILPYFEGNKDVSLSFVFDRHEKELTISTVFSDDYEDPDPDEESESLEPLEDLWESEDPEAGEDSEDEDESEGDEDSEEGEEEEKEVPQKFVEKLEYSRENPFVLKFSSLEDVEIEVEEEDKDQPLWVEFFITPEYPNYGEIYIYARLGSQPLWIE